MRCTPVYEPQIRQPTGKRVDESREKNRGRPSKPDPYSPKPDPSSQTAEIQNFDRLIEKVLSKNPGASFNSSLVGSRTLDDSVLPAPQFFEFHDRYRDDMSHVRQSGLDSNFGLQVDVLEAFQSLPSSFGSGYHTLCTYLEANPGSMRGPVSCRELLIGVSRIRGGTCLTNNNPPK